MPELVCERCGSKDPTVMWREIESGVSARLCAWCSAARSGANEPSGGLGWLLWVFIATMVGFAAVVAIVIVLVE